MAAGPTYYPIATTTLASAVSSYTFTGIPQTYTDLVVVINGRDTYAAAVASSLLRVGNGSVDSGTNYSYTVLQGNQTSITGYRGTTASFAYIGELAANSSTAGTFGMSTIHIQNYSNATSYKAIMAEGRSGNLVSNLIVSTWRNNTSAINTIQLLPSDTYTAGTTITIYGIKAA